MEPSVSPDGASPVPRKYSRPRPDAMRLPRFYPILDTEAALGRGIDPVHAAEEILDAGAEILQFRHKGFLSREAFAWLERIAGLANAAGKLLVINDRSD